MKTGKVSDTILSRSVLKPVNTVRGKYVKRLDIGQDAGEVQLACQADISSDCRDTLLMATASGYMPVIKAVNNIYAAGGVPVGLSDCIVMDKDSREIRLREVIAQLTRQSALGHVHAQNGHHRHGYSYSSRCKTRAKKAATAWRKHYNDWIYRDERDKTAYRP